MARYILFYEAMNNLASGYKVVRCEGRLIQSRKNKHHHSPDDIDDREGDGAEEPSAILAAAASVGNVADIRFGMCFVST